MTARTDEVALRGLARHRRHADFHDFRHAFRLLGRVAMVEVHRLRRKILAAIHARAAFNLPQKCFGRAPDFCPDDRPRSASAGLVNSGALGLLRGEPLFPGSKLRRPGLKGLRGVGISSGSIGSELSLRPGLLVWCQHTGQCAKFRSTVNGKLLPRGALFSSPGRSI